MKLIFRFLLVSFLILFSISYASAKMPPAVLLKYKSIAEDGVVTFDVINPGGEDVRILASGNQWGDRCYRLIIEEGNGIQTIVRVPQHVYTRNGPATVTISSDKKHEMSVRFDAITSDRVAKAVSVTLIYDSTEIDFAETGIEIAPGFLQIIPGEKVMIK